LRGARRRRLGVALLLAAVVAACGQPPLPPRLAGLSRARVWTGPRATRLAERTYEVGLRPKDSVVAEYGRPGDLRVWLARFRDSVQAHQALESVLERMRDSHSSWEIPRDYHGDPGRWYTVGPGGHHALWVSRRTVLWVTGEPARVTSSLARLPHPDRGTWM
jgi:hypothetical protein